MRINETRKRSLLKAVSFRIIEIALDTLILSFFITPAIAFGVAVAVECMCLILHYIFERIFNRISYGREIV
jgi:uncharacterized membrane protein